MGLSQEFLTSSEKAFRAHPVWATSPGEHQQQAIEVGSALKLRQSPARDAAAAAQKAGDLPCRPLQSTARDAGEVQGLEKYLMTKLYSKVFAVSESDRERDEALARRIEVFPMPNVLAFFLHTSTYNDPRSSALPAHTRMCQHLRKNELFP